MDVFLQHGLRQHVDDPTHAGGNVLNLIVTRDDEHSCRMVSQLTISPVCFSDHQLVTCRLGVPITPPVVTTYSTVQLPTHT